MKHSRYRLVQVLTILTAIFLQAGCGFRNLPPVSVYTIDLERADNNAGKLFAQDKKGFAVIQIAPVRGSAAFTSSNEILYTDIRHIQHSYAYSRWRDAPVKSMQALLEEALAKSGLFRAVLPATSVSGADFLLESTLLEFGHHLGKEGSSEGVVRMRFHLLDNKSRLVLSGTDLEARMMAATLDAKGAAAAINGAARKMSDELVVWLTGELSARQP
jgi:cholesterol transport system auxiliary component